LHNAGVNVIRILHVKSRRTRYSASRTCEGETRNAHKILRGKLEIRYRLDDR